MMGYDYGYDREVAAILAAAAEARDERDDGDGEGDRAARDAAAVDGEAS